ncbi:MAG: hypothetical protein QXH20_06870 [Candidatus Bathyarchaeia archaeon]
MLLSEMVRHIKREKIHLASTSYYSQTTVTDWVTKLSKTINLDAPSIIHVQFSLLLYSPATGSYTRGNGRVLINGVPVLATGEKSKTGAGSVEFPVSAFVFLPGGSYTFDFQIAVHRLDTDCYARLLNFYIRQLEFADVISLNQNSGDVNVPVGTSTVLDFNINFPARKLAVGKIKQAPLRLVVYVQDSATRLCVFKNPGETDAAGMLNWKLLLDNTQVSWTARAGDNDSGETANPTYSRGGCGYFEIILTAGTTYNIKLNVTNTTGASKTVNAILTILICPWIFGSSEFEPFNLQFPQGSTLYLTLEPLSSDPTKTIKLGYVRAWDLGYNYYSTASGTGILNWNYTFETVEVAHCVLTVSGNGGCISIIGVDVR